MTNISDTPHLDRPASAYRHHLAEHLAEHWRDLAASAATTAGAGVLAWATHYYLDEPVWAAVMAGVVLVMVGHWVRDVLLWPLDQALASAPWYGVDRIVYLNGRPVQVLDTDQRHELGGPWVLVRAIGAAEHTASWLALREVARTAEESLEVER